MTDVWQFLPLAPFMRERAKIHGIGSLLVLVATLVGAATRDPEDGSPWALLYLFVPIAIALMLRWMYQRPSGWPKITDGLRPVGEGAVVLDAQEATVVARRWGWPFTLVLAVSALWRVFPSAIVGIALLELFMGRSAASYEQRTGRQILRPRHTLGEPPFAWRPVKP